VRYVAIYATSFGIGVGDRQNDFIAVCIGLSGYREEGYFLSKFQLMDEVFSINDNTDLKKIQEARNKIVDYLKEHGEDPQIKDTLIILKIMAMENEYGDYEAAYELAEPIFKRLSQTDNWDFYDIRIFTWVIDCCSLDFDEIDLQAEKALKKLENHSYEGRYHHIKSAIHMNMLFRLLRTKYLERIDLQNKEVVRRLENTFLKHYTAIQDHNVLPPRRVAATVRKGAFFKDKALINKGYKELKELYEKDWIKSLEKELSDFERNERLVKDMISRGANISKNFKKAREARNLTKKEVAVYIFKTVHDITLVEEGRKMLSRGDLRRVAGLLGVTLVDLFEG